MLQRNDQGHVLNVMAEPTDDYPDLRPFTAGPGEVKDHPYPLAGWTLLDPPDDAETGEDIPPPDAATSSAPGSESDAADPPKPTRTRKSAATAAEGSDS